jgi:uncharacterized OsmC-like protein
VAVFVAGYCERAGLDARDLTVDVRFEKAEKPSRLVDLQIQVNLPHVDIGDREQALRRVAKHCTVHETIKAMADLNVTIVGQARQAA